MLSSSFQGVLCKKRICDVVLYAEGTIILFIVDGASKLLLKVTCCFDAEDVNDSKGYSKRRVPQKLCSSPFRDF